MNKYRKILLPTMVVMLYAVKVQAADLTIYVEQGLSSALKPVLQAFEGAEGIDIGVESMKSADLVKLLIKEGKGTSADLVVLTDLVNLTAAEKAGLFQPVKTSLIGRDVPSYLRHPKGLWYALNYRVRSIAYGIDSVDPSQLGTYADLANSEWQGKLCLRTSNKSYNKVLVASLIEHHGMSEATNILKGWVSNLASPPFAKDSQVLKAIAAGDCDVGVVNHYYLARELKKNSRLNIGFHFANQKTSGSHVNVNGIGMVHASQDTFMARKLMRFLLGARNQQAIASAAGQFQYPAKAGQSVDPIVKKFGAFKKDSTNLTVISGHLGHAEKVIKDAGYN